MARGHYDPSEPRIPKGSGERSGEWTRDEARAIRAKLTHKPSTAEKQAIGRANEARVAKMIGAVTIQQSWNSPLDVVAKRGKRTLLIEVKTLIDNSNDKVTVHGDSLARKEKLFRSMRAKGLKPEKHLVMVDHRFADGLFHHSGIGSFRKSTFTPAKSAAHLRKLLGL